MHKSDSVLLRNLNKTLVIYRIIDPTIGIRASGYNETKVLIIYHKPRNREVTRKSAPEIQQKNTTERVLIESAGDTQCGREIKKTHQNPAPEIQQKNTTRAALFESAGVTQSDRKTTKENREISPETQTEGTTVKNIIRGSFESEGGYPGRPQQSFYHQLAPTDLRGLTLIGEDNRRNRKIAIGQRRSSRQIAGATGD